MFHFALLLLFSPLVFCTSSRKPGDSVSDCALPCPQGHHCQLQEIWCIAAPCDPVPTCVADGKSHQLVLDRVAVGNANSYIDQVLTNVDQLIAEQGYDPFPLPEQTESWEQTVGLITFSAVASLYDGYLEGLSSLKRTGDVTLETNGSTVLVSADIGTDSLKAGYSMKAQFMGLGPKCSVSANIDEPEISIRLEVPASGGYPTISSFHITHLGRIKTSLHCGPLVDIFLHMLETVLNVISNMIKTVLATVLEGKIKELIQAQMHQLMANIIN